MIPVQVPHSGPYRLLQLPAQVLRHGGAYSQPRTTGSTSLWASGPSVVAAGRLGTRLSPLSPSPVAGPSNSSALKVPLESITLLHDPSAERAWQLFLKQEADDVRKKEEAKTQTSSAGTGTATSVVAESTQAPQQSGASSTQPAAVAAAAPRSPTPPHIPSPSSTPVRTPASEPKQDENGWRQQLSTTAAEAREAVVAEKLERWRIRQENDSFVSAQRVSPPQDEGKVDPSTPASAYVTMLERYICPMSSKDLVKTMTSPQPQIPIGGLTTTTTTTTTTTNTTAPSTATSSSPATTAPLSTATHPSDQPKAVRRVLLKRAMRKQAALSTAEDRAARLAADQASYAEMSLPELISMSARMVAAEPVKRNQVLETGGMVRDTAPPQSRRAHQQTNTAATAPTQHNHTAPSAPQLTSSHADGCQHGDLPCFPATPEDGLQAQEDAAPPSTLSCMKRHLRLLYKHLAKHQRRSKQRKAQASSTTTTTTATTTTTTTTDTSNTSKDSSSMTAITASTKTQTETASTKTQTETGSDHRTQGSSASDRQPHSQPRTQTHPGRRVQGGDPTLQPHVHSVPTDLGSVPVSESGVRHQLLWMMGATGADLPSPSLRRGDKHAEHKQEEESGPNPAQPPTVPSHSRQPATHSAEFLASPEFAGSSSESSASQQRTPQPPGPASALHDTEQHDALQDDPEWRSMRRDVDEMNSEYLRLMRFASSLEQDVISGMR